MIDEKTIKEFKEFIKLHPRAYPIKYYCDWTEEAKQYITIKMGELISFFKEKKNLILYPIYGTLLAIIRDGEYIPWDWEIDLAYLSKYSEIKDVLKEFIDLTIFFQNNKMLTKILVPGQMHITAPNDGTTFDIWTSFIQNNTLKIIPSVDSAKKEWIDSFKSISFRNTQILVPSNSEALLDYIYVNWKTPLYKIGNRGAKIGKKPILC
jgi:hypothetical protein